MDDIKKALVTTIERVDNEGTTDTLDKKRGEKPNVVEESVNSPISAKKNIDTVNKT